MRRHVIYCITNLVNGNRYVGQTCQSLHERWMGHVRSARSLKSSSCRILCAAIRKYGVDAFDRCVLVTVTTFAEANAAEAEWIRNLNCLAPHGYNIRSSGQVSRLHPDTIERLRRAATTEQRRDRNKRGLERRSAEQRSESARKAWRNMNDEARAARVISRRWPQYPLDAKC